jgi:hypothetical protein
MNAVLRLSDDGKVYTLAIIDSRGPTWPCGGAGIFGVSWPSDIDLIEFPQYLRCLAGLIEERASDK